MNPCSSCICPPSAGIPGMQLVLILDFAAVTKSWPKATWVGGGKGLCHLTDFRTSLEKPGQELKAGAWQQEPKQRHRGTLLTALLTVACSACFLGKPRTTCPGVAPPTVINPENDHYIDLLTGQSDGLFPQLRALFPGISSCVSLTENQPNNNTYAQLKLNSNE